MKLESQVVSLELAKKLKELGVKQESLFQWRLIWEGRSDEDAGEDVVVYQHTEYYNETLICSAFTVAELGEMLPYSLDVSYPTGYLHLVKIDKDGWHCCYVNGVGVIAKDGFRYQFTADTLADAMAKMLCYLLENRLINVAC